MEEKNHYNYDLQVWVTAGVVRSDVGLNAKIFGGMAEVGAEMYAAGLMTHEEALALNTKP